MKLLLTSGGVSNPTIHQALVGLLDKPIEECTALAIPTAMYGHRNAGPGLNVWNFVAGRSAQPQVELGWKSVGLLELTALPSIPRDAWEPLVRATDVLLFSGGEAVYLAHWMRESGFVDLLPELTDTVWVGMSAGSMVAAPRIGEDFRAWDGGESDETLGLVDFSIFPHFEHPMMPGNDAAEFERWAATIDNPAYALCDDSAVSVVDGTVEVVSEGQWRYVD
ncbi:dipeptidase E [Nocardioides ginsengisegetis]|uniref:Dipeptidase E n=1 Tax=Nocardioides ginsengisegetis TaxID=661491 RepID=A0A7W3P8Q5_9ACTN|nr:Type 1 glutamine amidotransferase-like domain-containing protein [Nocardioides ginsengisegetis]MBA8802845.1 dipeptidase E [Nocardioides ginsengisegetis]